MDVKRKKEARMAKSTVDEADVLALCTIYDDEKQIQYEKKVSFANGIKFKTPHADQLPSTQEAGRNWSPRFLIKYHQ